MRLYLVRHAEAMSEREDPERGLTVAGLADMERCAALVENAVSRDDAGEGLSEILHSTKKRAEETAVVLARRLRPERGVRASDGLLPLDDPGQWAGRMDREDRDIMLVGHMPQMGLLASLLITEKPDSYVISFPTSTVVCLEKAGPAEWRVEWVVNPEVAP